MKHYRLSNNVLIKRNSEIPEAQSVLEYIEQNLDDDAFNMERPFMSISLNRKVVVLNLTSSIILESLLKGTSKEEIVASLESVFDASPEQIAHDIDETTSSLLSRGVIALDKAQ